MEDLSARISGSTIEERIVTVRDRMAAAAARAGRDPGEVTLVAVSKTQPPEAIVSAYHSGVRLFGENRVQEARAKAPAVAALLAPAAAPEWHMVGHVQSRQADDVLGWASMVHSVDSIRLAERLSRFSVEEQIELPILLEVNVSGETSKYGLAPHALAAVVEVTAALPGLRLQGLMTMAPIAQDPEAVRPVFAALRRLKDDMARLYPGLAWRHLSMGMTDDYEVAIEEGATLVRIGRAIFGDSQIVCLQR